MDNGAGGNRISAVGTLANPGRISLFGKIDGGGMALEQWHSWTWSAETGAKLRITRNLGAVLAYRWFGSHFEDDTPEAVIISCFDQVRREVARLAETRGVAVVEDESLAELTLGAEPPPPIAAASPSCR